MCERHKVATRTHYHRRKVIVWMSTPVFSRANKHPMSYHHRYAVLVTSACFTGSNTRGVTLASTPSETQESLSTALIAAYCIYRTAIDCVLSIELDSLCRVSVTCFPLCYSRRIVAVVSCVPWSLCQHMNASRVFCRANTVTQRLIPSCSNGYRAKQGVWIRHHS